MKTPKELTKLALSGKLERPTTILEATAPASAGGISAAVVDGKVIISTWSKEHEIVIELSPQEAFALRSFMNSVVDAALNGTEWPAAFVGSRK